MEENDKPKIGGKFYNDIILKKIIVHKWLDQ